MANKLVKELNALDKELIEELVEVGKRVRQIRKHRKLTLEQLDALSEIDYSKLSKIERGKFNVEFQTILKIAKALQVKIMELFNYGGELPDNKDYKKPFPKTSKKRR